MHRRLTAIVLAASAAASLSTAVSTPAEAKRHTDPSVALGDSYASGAGIAPLDPAADPRCSQSQLNFAHVIAERTGAGDFIDVSCGGATTRDFVDSQHPGVAPQLEALSRDTRLITMTIGGNDAGVFGESFGGCAALTASDPTGNPCERAHGQEFERRVSEQTYPNLLRTFAAVRREAPRAKVAVPSYLRILPERGSAACTAAMGIAQGDVPYLNSLQKALNAAVEQAARKTGVRYVDLWETSTGHDACQSPDTRWVEPLQPINAAPVHPNARGEAVMAGAVIDDLKLPTR